MPIVMGTAAFYFTRKYVAEKYRPRARANKLLAGGKRQGEGRFVGRR